MNRKVIDIELDGIDTNDYPDFCDAFICNAIWSDTLKPLNDNELDALNDDREFVYELVMNHLF